MLAVYGRRSFYMGVRFLRLCPCLAQKFPQTLNDFNNLYSTSRWSLATTKPARKEESSCYSDPLSTILRRSPGPSRNDIQLNKSIRSLKTVEDHFELFESIKYSSDIVNRVTMLYSIATITERGGKQKQVLKQAREKSRQGQSSPYMELLESISRDISHCQPKGLANVMWALGKIEEKDHKLVQVCEKEILSRDMVSFNSAEICQMVNGCANLNLTTSDIFLRLQDSILNHEQVNIRDFENRQLSGILLSFSKMSNGSLALYDVFLEEIISRDFVTIGSRAFAEFVWSFAKRNFYADELFDRVEEEVLRRGTTDFHDADFVQMIWSFGKSGKGSKQFFSFLDKQLLSRGLQRFGNVQLLEIVWSFAKRKVTKAKVFDLVRKEVFNRGVHKFQFHELVLILFSFVSAQRHGDKLVTEIEGQMCSSDVKQFDNGDLCQVAWSLGRAGKSDSMLFDVIETELFQRGISDFTTKGKCMLMRGFIEAKRGSKEFYELLVGSFSKSDFSDLRGSEICECVWCFYKAGVEAGTMLVFDALEKEILAKGQHYFTKKQTVFIKEIFKRLGKERKELF